MSSIMVVQVTQRNYKFQGKLKLRYPCWKEALFYIFIKFNAQEYKLKIVKHFNNKLSAYFLIRNSLKQIYRK
jgi:hypothetical protein